MRRGILALVALAAALFGTGSAAQAADVMPMVVVSPTVAAAASAGIAANVELFGAMARNHPQDLDETDCQGCHENGTGFGGLARAAIPLGTALSLQLDVWGESINGEARFDGFECDDCFWSSSRFGIAGHLTWNSDAFQAGILASLGRRESDDFAFGSPIEVGTFANIAAEAVWHGDAFRLYGQVGSTFAVGNNDANALWDEFSTRAFYARLLGTWYASDNLAISANVGLSRVTFDGDLGGRGLTFGARGDYAFGDGPLFVFASYQGAINRFGDGDLETTEHMLRAGLGITLGGGGIRGRDRDAGLQDFNDFFGTTGTAFGVPGYAVPNEPPPP